MLRRLSFLPTFFAILVIVFAILVVLRIRSHASNAPPPATSAGLAARGSHEIPAAGVTAPRSAATSSKRVPIERGASTAAAAEERQKRYAELLRGTPASAPPPSRNTATPAAKPQSFLSRVVSPIVNAFGGRETPAVGAAEAAQRTSPAESHAGPHASKETSGQPKEAKDPREVKDPNSDTTPPPLIAISFDPPEVQDGGSTILTVIAIDEGSGIRSISGNVISPANSLMGFAVDRVGDSTRYITRLTIPKNAAEGIFS